MNAPARPTPAAPLVAALAAVALLAACAWFFVGTRRGQVGDEIALRGATIGTWRWSTQAEALLQTVSVGAVAVALAVVVVVGLAAGRPRAALVGAAVIGAANVTTQVVKNVLVTRPDLIAGDHTANSLPSGHTTVAASIVVGLALVAGRRAVPLVTGVGAAVVTAFGYATLVNQWHRPSDVVAAVLVACAWGYVGEAALRAGPRPPQPTSRRRPARRPAGAGPSAGWGLVAAGGLALGVAVVAVALMWGVGLDDATRLQRLVAHVGGSAALAGVTCSGLGVLARLRSA
ncbi:phosphatase PAP2 family protein [Propioniciclava soli]|uniref:phosphatase PAP2 family protein n=1 Tax=Propioniciclava soli TaxID=2775081 RepID=UPI001E4274CC